MKRELLFLLFLLYFKSTFAYKIGYISDGSLEDDHRDEMKEKFEKFIAKLNSDGILSDTFTAVEKEYSLTNSPNDFDEVWTYMLNQGVVAVFSYCNFINVNNLKNYDIIGDDNTILFCGTQDVASVCLKNVVFYSSSKAVMYRYAEYVLYHKINKKMLILKDDTPSSDYFYNYFIEVLDLYNYKSYTNMTLTSSTQATDVNNEINTNLGEGGTVINLIEDEDVLPILKSSFGGVTKEVDMFHSPLMHEFKSDTLSSEMNTDKINHYHLLSYVSTETVSSELNSIYGDVDEHHLYQFIVIMEVYKKVLNRVKSVDYDSIISGLMNQEYETFNNETNIRIRDDFHGDVNYFIAKYEEDSGNVGHIKPVINYTLLYNWFDVFYKYGKPNPEPVGCNYLYGIYNRSSYTDVTVVMIYGDWTYSESDSNDNIIALMLFWSEVSYLMASDQLMNVELIVADKQVNKLIDSYKETRQLNLVIMMLKNSVKEKILNVIQMYNKDILVFDFGFEEGEKCYKNVVMISFFFLSIYYFLLILHVFYTGISANQYADQLVDYFRAKEKTSVFLIMSSTSVSVTAGEVLTSIFESHSIKIVGKYTVLANGDNGRLQSSLEESAPDGITIINLAEGEYLKTIIDGISDRKYEVISVMTSEYEQLELEDEGVPIPDTYYFMGMTYNNKTNSEINPFIHQLFVNKIGRDAIVNSKMVTMYAIINLWLRAASFGGVDNIARYQKFLYNYPLILDDDLVYVLNSNNYGGSQLSIIHYNTQTLYFAGTWIADALAYTNNSYSCDFSFDEGLGMENIQEQDYYHIGVLYDFGHDSEQLSDLDYVIQIFNRQTINNKKILLHYGNVKYDDVSTYVKAVESFVQLYPDTALCFIGTSSVEQRKAISETLIKVDKLLFVPSTIYKSECYKNIMMLGPGLFQRLSFALISLLRMTQHIVIIGDNASPESQYSAGFLQQYTQRFEAPCCVNNEYTDLIWYTSVKATGMTWLQYFQYYTSGHPQIISDAVFFLVLSPEQTEEILTVLKEVFTNRETHKLVAFDMDEKKLSQAKDKAIFDGVYVPGMYFSERTNEQNLMLQSFIKTFYGDVSVMLSTTSVMLYETFLVIKKAVELTNSISGEVQRIGIYNQPIETPEGDIILYTSNHVDHHIVIGMVRHNSETDKYDIHIMFQYQFAIFPMVYLPLVADFYTCDWATFTSVGTRASDYLNIYFIGDYVNKYEETGSLAILMQGVVNSINLKGGMLSKELIFSFLGCPKDFEYIAERAVHLAETKTVVIFSNCKASTIDFMARAFTPTRMMMITFGFNPGNVCKQLVLSAYPSPYQILMPTMLELVSKGYEKYYIVSSNTSEYNAYLPIAKNLLDDFSQDIFDIYVFENEATVTNDEIKTVVYNICNGLQKTGGIVISFLTQPLHHKLLKRFKIFEDGTGIKLSIQFISYSYRDVDKIDREVDVGNYAVVNYIPYLDTPENVAFKNDVQAAFPEKEFHYIDALAHSLLTTWVSVLSKLTVLDFNAVLPLIYTSTLRTPVGLVSIDSSNHIHQSVFLLLVGEDRESDEITELTSGLQGNPYFNRLNEKTRRICDWTTYVTDDYEPPVCHIGISSSFNKLDIYDSVQVLRGTLGAMEYINSHDSVNTIGCYLLPYLLHESDLEKYKDELKLFGEMTMKQGKIIGSIVLGGFTSNCLNEEILDLYKQYHILYFYIKRTVGERCNREIVYMSESLHNNFAFSRTFSSTSSNVVLLYDPSDRSTEAYNVLYPELIRYGYTVIVRKISDVVTNMNSVADFIKSTVENAIIVNLITHEGSRMIFEVFVGKGLIPPNYIIYTYFSKTEKFANAAKYKSPFYSYIWSYPCDTESGEYQFIYQLFTSIKYNDEYVMLSFATLQIYYFEIVQNKNLIDMNDFTDFIYNKEFKTIIGKTIINSNNMLRKPLNLFRFQDGILTLAYTNTYQPTYPTVYSLYEDPITVCDWKSEIAINGTYERQSIHIAIILNRKNDKLESNWFNGIDISVQYYNQENDDKAIVYDIYEYNDDYEKMNEILDWIYGNNSINNNRTKAIFACREEKCLSYIKNKVNANNILLFTTAKEEGQKCNKMIISLGLLPNQYLETMMNYIISSTTGNKAIYYFGLDDSYSKTLFNLTEGIYKGIIDIKGSSFVSDTASTIDNSLMLQAVDLLESVGGGYIVCSLNAILFSNLMKVSKRYIGYLDIKIISLNNDNTEVEYYASIDDYVNVIMVDSYLPGIDSYYSDVVKHYSSFERVDGTFARSFESVVFFQHAYFTLDQARRTSYDDTNVIISAEELRNQLYYTQIQGFVETISLQSNNHAVRGVYLGKYNDEGEIDTLLPFNSRIVPATYNKLYEESYNYYCNFLIQDDKIDDKVHAVLFLLSLTGKESEFYVGVVTIVEEFFAQINEDNTLDYTLTYMLEDTKSDDNTCINLVDEYKNKVIAIFGTPTIGCIQNMKLDDGKAIFISFSRELGEICSIKYFSATFDFAQYDSAIAQILYLDPPAVGIIAYEAESQYIERQLKKFLVTPFFNAPIINGQFNRDELFQKGMMPPGSVIFYAGPSDVVLGLDVLSDLAGGIKIVLLSNYRIAIQNLRTSFYAISPYFPELENKENEDFIDKIKKRLSDDTYITPEMEYLYSALHMVYNALENTKNVEDPKELIISLENVVYNSPEGTISYENNHRLKHYVYRGKSVGNKEAMFIIEDKSALTPGEVYSLSNSDTTYRTCYFQNGEKIELTQAVKSFGVIISDYKEEKVLLYNIIYATMKIDQEHGLLGNYINVVPKQCNDTTLDLCWQYVDEMRKSDDIIFTFTGTKENAILYYTAKMDEENAEEFLIDFPKFSENFCTHHSYHYFVTPSELARGIALLALQIGKEYLIVYSETTESKEVAHLTENILIRYNTNLRGKISPRTLSSLMSMLRNENEGLVLISALNHEDSITFLNRIGASGITAKQIPIIHAFLDGNDILQIKPEYIPNNYIVTSFHEAIADSNNYESNEKTETSNTFEVPTQAKPFVEGIKGFIGNNPITPIQEAVYTAVRSMAKLYELAYSSSTLKLRSLLMKYLYNAPSGETYITETSFLARRIWTIRYNDQNQPKIVPNIMTTVTPEVFDYYANETLGMECTINTEADENDNTKYNTKVVKHDTKEVLFYHELTSEDGLSETTRALIEAEIVKTINDEHSFGDFMMIPKFEFGNISNYAMVKAAKQYIYDDNILAAFGCATPECRQKIGSVYDDGHKLFYYTGYNEGDSCNAYILNFGNLPNEKVKIALTMASRNDISVYVILGRNDSSTFIRSNQTKEFVKDSAATLVGECYYNLAENKEDVNKVSSCISKAIEDNPNSGRLGVLVYYYGQDFIELVNGMSKFPFKKDALLYILFHYDESILSKKDVMDLSGSYIIATYEPSIESMNNEVFKNTIKNYLFNDVYISEELENTYEAMQVWKSITINGQKKNDGVVPNDDFLRIVSQEIITSSPACDLSLTSSNYVTKCIYVLQIEENAGKTQIYPVSGEQDVVTPEPYLDQTIEKENCVFGKIKKYYDSKSIASTFCLFLFVAAMILILAVGFLLKYFNWTKVVRCSSPPFMYATLAGLTLLSVTGYLFSFPPLEYKWVCTERVWMLSLSVDIIFSIMFSKAWRIHKLFNNMQLKRINISNSQLFRFVLFVVIIQCGYNGLWWGLDPSKYTETRTNTYSTYYEDVYIPQCTESYPFVIIQLVIVFGSFIFGVNLAWKVRKASKEYNESLSLAITILVVLFLGIILVPLNYVMSGEPNTLMVLRSGGCQLTVICVLILQFGLKIYAIGKEAGIGSTYVDSFTSKGSMSKKQGRKSKRSQYESMRNSRLSSVRSVRPFFLSTYKFSTPQTIAVAVLPYLKYTDPELNGDDPTAGGQTPVVGPRGSTANLGSINQGRSSTANLSNNNIPQQQQPQRPPPRLSVGVQMNQNNVISPMQNMKRKSVNDLGNNNNNNNNNNNAQKSSPAQPSDNKNMTRVSLAERRPVN